MNSASDNRSYAENFLLGTSFKSSMLICWSCTLLKVKWRVHHRSSILRHSWLLYLITSTASSFHLLIHFIRSHRPPFLLVVSWILRSEMFYFVLLTMFLLNCFQSSTFLEVLYLLRSLLQFISHQLLEFLVILTIFE